MDILCLMNSTTRFSLFNPSCRWVWMSFVCLSVSWESFQNWSDWSHLAKDICCRARFHASWTSLVRGTNRIEYCPLSSETRHRKAGSSNPNLCILLMEFLERAEGNEHRKLRDRGELDVSRHKNPRDTQSSTWMMGLHEITKVSTPGWNQYHIEYSEKDQKLKVTINDVWHCVTSMTNCDKMAYSIFGGLTQTKMLICTHYTIHQDVEKIRRLHSTLSWGEWLGSVVYGNVLN